MKSIHKKVMLKQSNAMLKLTKQSRPYREHNKSVYKTAVVLPESLHSTMQRAAGRKPSIRAKLFRLILDPDVVHVHDLPRAKAYYYWGNTYTVKLAVFRYFYPHRYL